MCLLTPEAQSLLIDEVLRMFRNRSRSKKLCELKRRRLNRQKELEMNTSLLVCNREVGHGKRCRSKNQLIGRRVTLNSILR